MREELDALEAIKGVLFRHYEREYDASHLCNDDFHKKGVEILNVVRAHLSRPVVGDEQMREALSGARLILECEGRPGVDYSKTVSRALLAMSEQLAAEREKVRALQPAYNGMLAAVSETMDFLWNGGKPSEGKDVKAYRILMEAYQKHAVRVCKMVEGDG